MMTNMYVADNTLNLKLSVNGQHSTLSAQLGGKQLGLTTKRSITAISALAFFLHARRRHKRRHPIKKVPS
jgi:hypothetical protein